MRVRRSTLWLMILAVMAVGSFWALDRLTNASVEPLEKRPDKIKVVYLGQATFPLSGSFQIEAGRLQMICEGSAEMTTVVEVPYEGGGQLYDRLSLLVPEGARHYLMKDLSPEIKRPAHLIFTDPGSTETLASVIMDFGWGSIRLSRPVKYDPETGYYESLEFENDARRFAQNYYWGHNGSRPSDLHSLYGRVRLEQGCGDYQANIRFTSEYHSLKLVMANDRSKDLAAIAADNDMELALDDYSGRSPGRFSELSKLKRGILNRKVRGGPRQVAGQPGFEWVALRHDISTGRKLFLAFWRPEGRPNPAVPALIMSADQSEAGRALAYWNDLMNGTMIIGGAKKGSNLMP